MKRSGIFNLGDYFADTGSVTLMTSSLVDFLVYTYVHRLRDTHGNLSCRRLVGLSFLSVHNAPRDIARVHDGKDYLVHVAVSYRCAEICRIDRSGFCLRCMYLRTCCIVLLNSVLIFFGSPMAPKPGRSPFRRLLPHRRDFRALSTRTTLWGLYSTYCIQG